MIMINGNWEQVKDLSDIIRIVNENIGYEFAQKVEEICGEPSEELEEQNFMLQNKLDNIKESLKEVRKIFIKVLDIADNELENNEYEEYLEEFDNAIDGDKD